jgi:energy-coupling factor transporter ATP-binding protein EcfA2
VAGAAVRLDEPGMIRNIQIENFKSIERLTLELGRLTVLIGANGSGKSNILEAIAFAAAATHNQLDNEFLSSRGIRVTETRFMRSAFGDERPAGDAIKLSVSGDGGVSFECDLRSNERPSSRNWRNKRGSRARKIRTAIEKLRTRGLDPTEEQVSDILDETLLRRPPDSAGSLPGFLVYAPEKAFLRTFQREGQILPLGITGEGLFAHLVALDTDAKRERLAQIMQKLSLFDWFERFEIPEALGTGDRSIRIRDRYLAEGALFHQLSASDGFLFLLFYFTLFISPDTPAFFAIDSLDACLDPKLCSTVIRELVALAAEHGKQAIVTTHNPAVLDGLDLHDDEQGLLVIDRDLDGHTTARRIHPPAPLDEDPPVRLSEAFLRGYIGGLPKNF